MKTRKVILITGASRGIGPSLAEELSSRGHRVYGTGRTRLKEELPFHYMVLDMTNGRSVKKAVGDIIKAEGSVDVLVNNAGVSHCGSVEETPETIARDMFETNYFGPIFLIRGVLPHMRERRSGTIVNVTSAAGKIGRPFEGHYSASKFAMEGLSETLRLEVTPFGIRVIVVEPGDVGTAIWEHTAKTEAGNSPYEGMLRRFLAVKAREMGDSADSPGNVARQIADAIESKGARFRFPVAKMAGLIMAAQKILPERLFLKIIANNYNLYGK